MIELEHTPLYRCCLDVDGVLTAFWKHAADIHGRPDPYPEHDNYYMEKIWGISAKDFFAPMGYDFWITMPLTDEAPRLLQLVADNFADSCLLTSPCETVGCVQGKVDWIKKNLPQYRRKTLIGACKEFCAMPRMVLIDDRAENIESFVAAGGHGILFPRPYNANRHIALAGRTMDYVASLIQMYGCLVPSIVG